MISAHPRIYPNNLKNWEFDAMETQKQPEEWSLRKPAFQNGCPTWLLTKFSNYMGLFFMIIFLPLLFFGEGLPLFYWQEDPIENFGDVLSRVLVERIVETPLKCYVKRSQGQEKKLLACGSILSFAADHDVIWGSGVHGKVTDKKHYNFTQLDILAVRGPITRAFLMKTFQIDCPEFYGDPALL